MGSDNERSTGCEQPERPQLCANGCGFFGTPATMNLCSKCYRDHRVKEEQEASAKAAVEKSLNPSSSSPASSITKTQAKTLCTSVDSASSSAASTSSEATVQSDSGVKRRCSSCNKKVGLTGFKCRCGSTFCGSHRYPEKHDCSFDYKTEGREAIAKANPVVKAGKLQMI